MMHLAPDGLVLHTGPESEAFFVDVSGSGAILGGPARSPAMNGSGNSILYAEGKVLVVGGGDPPRATAEVIDLTAPAPAWRPVAPMAHPRVLQNAVILADGKVLVTGGTSGAGFNNRIGAVREAELWEPETETWQELAPQSVPRLYHSVSVLLADGRVLSGGGGSPPASNGGTDNLDAEVFSPPYLFRGARPVIQGAPDQAAWDQTITVQTTHAAHIARVNLIRLTSVTHSTNMEQRLARPSFTATADALDVHVPANPHLLPAGHYLLFIVDHTGVPSEGRVIRIGS
jgi:hypothetical protein